MVLVSIKLWTVTKTLSFQVIKHGTKDFVTKVFKFIKKSLCADLEACIALKLLPCFQSWVKFKFHIAHISSVSAGQGEKTKPKSSFQIQPNIHVNQQEKLPLASSDLEDTETEKEAVLPSALLFS